MRGSDAASGALFSYVDMEARVPATHPLRTIRTIVNEVLDALDTEFEVLYEGTGRQSVAPERLLRASLLQAFYSVRSERQLMEQINYNLLFRWFVGLGIDDAVWDHSTFSKNRERLLGADVAAKFLAAVLRHPKVPRFLSDEHFSVDGTLVEAWASLKSFRAKDGSDEPPAPGRNGERHFHNEKRRNETHASTTDPDARLYRKGSSQAAKLSYMGHALMENRHGLVVGATLTPATGTAEREAAIKMIVRRSPGARRLTLGADKGYDTKNFVADLRELNIAPHVAQNTTNRASAIDGPHDAASWQRCQPDRSQADREKLRLDQDVRRTAQIHTQGCGSRRVPFLLCNGSLNFDPDAQIALDRRLRPIICQKAD
jgi:transposase